MIHVTTFFRSAMFPRRNTATYTRKVNAPVASKKILFMHPARPEPQVTSIVLSLLFLEGNTQLTYLIISKIRISCQITNGPNWYYILRKTARMRWDPTGEKWEERLLRLTKSRKSGIECVSAPPPSFQLMMSCVFGSSRSLTSCRGCSMRSLASEWFVLESWVERGHLNKNLFVNQPLCVRCSFLVYRALCAVLQMISFIFGAFASAFCGSL